jgi:hypothetical protein
MSPGEPLAPAAGGIVCMVMIAKFGPRIAVMFGGIVVAIAW